MYAFQSPTGIGKLVPGTSTRKQKGKKKTLT